MPFEVKIVDDELHLILPLRPFTCPACGRVYHQDFKSKMSEQALVEQGIPLMHFVGIPEFPGDGEPGRPEWGRVYDQLTKKSHLVCGLCYDAVAAARRAGQAEADRLGAEVAARCRP